MKPYTIVCTTCQARLRVRKAAAIGQILACPKCGSMVLIEPPPDGSAGNSGSGSAPEIAPAAKAPSKSPPARKPRFREDFPENETSVPVPPEPVSTSDSDMPPVAPPLDAGTAAHTRLQQWGILVVAGLAGIVLAIFVLALLAGRGCGKHEPTHPASSTTSKQTPPPKHERVANDTQKPLGHDSTHGAHQTATTNTQDTKSASGEPAKKKASGTEPPSSTTDKSLPPTGSNSGPSNPSPPNKSAITASSPHGNPADKTKNDAPPGLLPRRDTTTKTPPVAPSNSSNSNTSASGIATGAFAPGTRDAIPNVTDAGAATAKVDVAARLGMMILNEQIDHITLAEFAKFVSKLTALPVTLKMDPIIADGLTATTELSVTVQAVTVKQMIEAALKPAGLTLHVARDQLVITTPADENPKRVSKNYGVADLAVDAPQSQALGKLIVALIAPATWEAAGGAGILMASEQKLEINQTVQVHFEIACFLDRLRVARGLRPLGNLPEAFIDLRPLFQQVAKALQRKLSISIAKPTPVADILQRISAETDLLLLVDWQAVAPLGITPQFKTTLDTNDQPLQVVLNGWLGPAKLAYRVVDPHTLQISTQADVDTHLEVQIYRLRAKPKDEAELDHLLQEATKYVGTSFFKSHGGQGALRYDAASNSLIASLPQPRQQALAQWLVERQTE